MSDPSLPAAPPRWRVIAQTPQLVPNNRGQFVQGYNVTAQVVVSGTTFSVTVPANEYTANNVRLLLADRYEQVAHVDRLEG